MKNNFEFIPYEKTLFYTLKCLLLNAPITILIILAQSIVEDHSYVFIAILCLVYILILLLLNQKIKLNSTIMNVIDQLSIRISTTRRFKS